MVRGKGYKGGGKAKGKGGVEGKGYKGYQGYKGGGVKGKGYKGAGKGGKGTWRVKRSANVNKQNHRHREAYFFHMNLWKRTS